MPTNPQKNDFESYLCPLHSVWNWPFHGREIFPPWPTCNWGGWGVSYACPRPPTTDTDASYRLHTDQTKILNTAHTALTLRTIYTLLTIHTNIAFTTHIHYSYSLLTVYRVPLRTLQSKHTVRIPHIHAIHIYFTYTDKTHTDIYDTHI